MHRFFITLVVVVTILGSGSAYSQSAQNTLAPAPQQAVTIKPKMKLSDVKAVAGFITSVEIRGTEVDAYLDTRKVLMDIADAGAKAGKKDEDEVTVEMRLDQAQNLFTLMQRGQLKGAEAEKWREIVSSLQEAVKAAQEAKK